MKTKTISWNIKQNEDRNNKLEQLKIEAKQIEALELNEKQRKLEMKINEEQTKAQGKKK